MVVKKLSYFCPHTSYHLTYSTKRVCPKKNVFNSIKRFSLVFKTFLRRHKFQQRKFMAHQGGTRKRHHCDSNLWLPLPEL